MRQFRTTENRLHSWCEGCREIRRVSESAGDRPDENLEEQKADTAKRCELYRISVMASNWRERNQKPHPKVRQRPCGRDTDNPTYRTSPWFSLAVNPPADFGKTMASPVE